MLEAPGYEQLITALYPKGDKYITSDAVFGVKSSLVCELKYVEDTQRSSKLGFINGAPFWELQWDFVLQTVEEAAAEKRRTLPHFHNTA